MGNQSFTARWTISSGTSLKAQRTAPALRGWEVRGGAAEDSGDNRLSRQGHYHGPDGLNGRVRNGNGCDPAGMVAGKAPGGRSGRAGCRFQSVVRSRSQDQWARERAPCFSTEWTPTAADHWPEALVGGQDISSPRFGRRCPVRGEADGSGWSSIRLLELVRCDGRPSYTPSPSTWSSSRSLRTYSAGNLVLKRASRLDAFSAYPFPTWLPGGAPSGTAGTPEVGPPQSSRTRGDPSQVSYAHGR